MKKEKIVLIGLVLIGAFVSISFAREIDNLRKHQMEIKYEEELKDESFHFCSSFEKKDLQKMKAVSGNKSEKRLPLKEKGGDLSLQEIGTMSLIEIGGKITKSLKLESGKEYYATSSVIVDGGYLVHEPGAIVYWAENTQLIIRNGGTYLSRGLPGNFNDLCMNMGTYEIPGHWKGILIEETASPNTEIRYTLVWDADVGIDIRNQTLNSFIEHNYVGYCNTGIRAYGPKHTKIMSNNCYRNHTGIRASYRSYDGVADPNESVVYIAQNTSHYNFYGMIVNMIDDDNLVSPIVENNISAASYYYNYFFADGIASPALVQSNGSWLDPEIRDPNDHGHIFFFDPEDWGIIVEEDPNSPFIGYYADEVFLNRDSVFVNAGTKNILHTRYMGMTTDYYDRTPDSGKIDLGFHYSNWFYSNVGKSTLRADINNSLSVDFDDLLILIDYWLFDYRKAYQVWLMDRDNSGTVDMGDLLIIAENWLSFPYDFNFFAEFSKYWLKQIDPRIYDVSPDIYPDGIVNFKDFSILASEWGQTAEADPNIIINTFINPETKQLEVGISGYRPDTYYAFLFLDGAFVDEIFGFKEGGTVSLNTTELGNNYAELKAIVVNDESRVTCSNLKFVELDNRVEYLKISDAYEPNEPDYFALILDDPNSIVQVNVFDVRDDLVWTQTYPSDGVVGFIPSEITSDYDLERVDFVLIDLSGPDPNESDPNNIMMATSSTSSGALAASTVKTRWFNPKKVPDVIDSLIIIPDHWTNQNINSHVTNIVRDTFGRTRGTYELKGIQARSHNIAWFAKERNVKYIYYSGHGNYEFGGKLRTGIKLRDGVGFSVRASDFPDPNNIPSWCEEMDKGYESGKNLSFAQMRFQTLKYVFFDCCFSGRLKLDGYGNLVQGKSGSQGILDSPDCDMSIALGSPAYQGWYDESSSGTRSTFSQFSKNQFEKLRTGENVYSALNHAISNSRIDPKTLLNPAEYFRIKGRKNIMELKIE